MRKSIISIFIIVFFISGCQTIDNNFKQKIITAKEISNTFIKDNSIPGMAVSVSINGELIWSEGFGYSNIEKNIKVVANQTLFRVASISKPITALAMAKLVDDKLLSFDESVYTYIPDYPKKEHDFTVRQVAGHIAGIRGYLGNEFIMNKKMTIVEGLDIFKDSPLTSKPGDNYSYSTYGWNLLSVVVQNAANTEFNSYMQSTVFNPLEMNNTTVELSDAITPNKTQFYYKTKENNIVLAPTVSNEHKVSGGGFISTSEDLIKFGNEILNPTQISKESLNELLTSLQTSDGKETNYGIGFVIRDGNQKPVRYSHSGGGVGATTFLMMFPEEEIVISIVTNLSGVPIRQLVNQLEGVFTSKEQ